MEDIKRVTDSFEKASQEFFKETWEFAWTLIGVVVLLVLVGFGIYFSQVAIAAVIGAAGIMLYFTWSASIAISALEVAGIKLLGDRNRSMNIAASNRAEHGVSKWFTYLLFVFDIITNWSGLFITATGMLGGGEKILFGGWVVIIFFGALMAISEILVGWMIRAVATSYVSFLQAKQKYEHYRDVMERSVLGSLDGKGNNGNNQNRQNNNRPAQSFSPQDRGGEFGFTPKPESIPEFLMNRNKEDNKHQPKGREEYVKK